MSSQGQAWQKDAADQNFDYMFKLLIIGNSSVGKTSFLFRYADDSFTSAFVSTVGIDFKVKTVFRQDKRVKLQIWVSKTEIGFWYERSSRIFTSTGLIDKCKQVIVNKKLKLRRPWRNSLRLSCVPAVVLFLLSL
jgi:GTPase SAR1 family protein